MLGSELAKQSDGMAIPGVVGVRWTLRPDRAKAPHWLGQGAAQEETEIYRVIRAGLLGHRVMHAYAAVSLFILETPWRQTTRVPNRQLYVYRLDREAPRARGLTRVARI